MDFVIQNRYVMLHWTCYIGQANPKRYIINRYYWQKNKKCIYLVSAFLHSFSKMVKKGANYYNCKTIWSVICSKSLYNLSYKNMKNVNGFAAVISVNYKKIFNRLLRYESIVDWNNKAKIKFEITKSYFENCAKIFFVHIRSNWSMNFAL